MTRREFLQLGTWATIAAALRVKEDAATGRRGDTATDTDRPHGWGMPWQIGWQISEQPIQRQFLPVVNNGNA